MGDNLQFEKTVLGAIQRMQLRIREMKCLYFQDYIQL